jgi:chemotaxis protein histidine kinase CheA/CheY-like chemotaxis protein
MQPEQQQRIMGYFIEEAKDHLNTIEQGLLNLQNTLEDSEMANEVFRAAHSVKGGAAMLGLGSIQRVSHRLEDFFKILKEAPRVRTDQKLESLLLRVFDTLQELLEQLQSPFGITDESASNAMENIEPVFGELEQHLNQLVASTAATPVAPATASYMAWFHQQVPSGLRSMLELFKQADMVSDARAQLKSCCTALKLQDDAVPAWNLLLGQVDRAIGSTDNAYRTLAGVVLKDLKQAQELVLAGRGSEVVASPALQALLPLAVDAGMDDLFAMDGLDDGLDLGFADGDLSLDGLGDADFELGDGDLDFGSLEAGGLDSGDLDLGSLDLGSLDVESALGDLDPMSNDDDFGLGGGLDLDGLDLDGIALEAGGSDDWSNWSADDASMGLELGELDLAGLDLDGDRSAQNTSSASKSDELLDPNLLNAFADNQEGNASLWQDMSRPGVSSAASMADDDDLGLDLLDDPVAAASINSLDLGDDLMELDEESSASLDDLGELFMGLDESDLTFVQEDDNFTSGSLAPGEEDDGMGELDLDLFDLPDEVGVAVGGLALGGTVAVAGGLLSNSSHDDIFDGMALFDEDPLAMATSVELSRDTDALGLGALELDGDELEMDFGSLDATPPFSGLDLAAGADLDLGNDNLNGSELDFGLGELDLENLGIDGLGDDDALSQGLSSDDSTFLHTDVLASELDLGLDDDLGSLDLGDDLGMADLGMDGLDDLNLDEVTTDLQMDMAEGSSDELLGMSDLEMSDLELSNLEMSDLEATGLDLEAADFGSFDLGGGGDLGGGDLTDGFSLDGDSDLLGTGDFGDLDLDLYGDDGNLGDGSADDLGGLAGAIAEPEMDFSLGEDSLGGLLDEGSDDSGFGDFDALLGGAAVAGLGAVAAGTAFAQAKQTPAPSSEENGFLADGMDLDNMDFGEEVNPGEFDGLDALLDEPGSGQEDSAFSNLDSLLVDGPSSMAPATITSGFMDDDAEFGDLEKLLEDSDSPGSGMLPGKGIASAVRRPARPSKGFAEQTMRVPVKHLDNLSNLVGELVVNRNSLEQDQERMRQSLDNLLYQVQQLSDVGQRMQDLYERSLLESSLVASRQHYRGISALTLKSMEPVRDTSEDVEYDPLEMDRFTGFHTLSQEMIELIVRVRESASDIEFIVDETDQVTRMFRQVTTQLSEGLTRSRMVPFAQTADRLPRAVRDIAMKCGKQAELVIEGRETLIDKMILEQLYDPMTHLVNNAITHGIESPEVRNGGGKTSAGRITIRAFHQGNQTVISVSDDGAGIDVERVRSKAVEKGLLSSSEAQTMSRLDLYDLLFHPGFSTRDQADDFAGRGVGMDVVRTSLTEVRGVINTDSALGKGTTFTIRLPLTLSISKALCCISDRARIAFPMDGVEDMLDLPKERIIKGSDGQISIPWRDTVLPLRPLTELLSLNRHLSRGTVYGGSQEEDMVSIVVLRSAGNYLALQVDQVLGEQEIVIKQLEGPVPKPVGIAGATVLGDGRIMPIADVLELLDLAMGRIRRDAGSMWEQSPGLPIESLPEQSQPMVLIVDDSITVRELLSMTFNKVGYRVEQARDGQEAWEKLRSGLPCDIVFCDIEMPRMDGLELLSRIQKDASLKKMPIAMLTSRGADRHRQMAVSLGARGYFTKPYLEEALLDAAARMLKGEVLISNA